MAQLLPPYPSIPRLIPRSCRVPPTQTWVDRCPQPTFCPAPNFTPFSAHCRAPHAAQVLPLLSSFGVATGTRLCPALSAHSL